MTCKMTIMALAAATLAPGLVAAAWDAERAGGWSADVAPGARAARTPADHAALREGPLTAMGSAVHAATAGRDAIGRARLASATAEAGNRTAAAILDRSQRNWTGADGRRVNRRERDAPYSVGPDEIATQVEDRSETDVTNAAAADHPYVGLWVTEDQRVRHRLLPNGRYVEARGSREAAYEGRYKVTGDHIEYWDDTGFTADGDFVDGVLRHAGMILRRRD